MSKNLREEITELHAGICSGLADPVRILIIYALSDSPRNVNELAEYLNLPQPTASRHLKLLRQQGLVNGERDGLYIYYSLTDERIIEALNLLRKVLNDRLTYRASLVESQQNIYKHNEQDRI
ncbi:MAG: winged helix-turn-helix transcriptional regulator [Anaerolineae bacterium]|jgi:DNA-binding transcriptional ArsR family regulator|nr:winged helix-turn-helix transcriptional regulator [Anaerolineae bacterium]MBT7070060.1 winged helix-turn-helix transcriptional regulator [Anaerolineae bacterium]MBT7323601.1 winged helix-turn-helix transcriptional regulator [Anaerolineae bacterium]